MIIREFVSNKSETISDLPVEDKLIRDKQRFLGIK